jgi:hypothetical protein
MTIWPDPVQWTVCIVTIAEHGIVAMIGIAPPHLEAVQPGSDNDDGAFVTTVPVFRQVFVQGRTSLTEQSSLPQPGHCAHKQHPHFLKDGRALSPHQKGEPLGRAFTSQSLNPMSKREICRIKPDIQAHLPVSALQTPAPVQSFWHCWLPRGVRGAKTGFCSQKLIQRLPLIPLHLLEMISSKSDTPSESWLYWLFCLFRALVTCGSVPFELPCSHQYDKAINTIKLYLDQSEQHFMKLIREALSPASCTGTQSQYNSFQLDLAKDVAIAVAVTGLSRMLPKECTEKYEPSCPAFMVLGMASR